MAHRLSLSVVQLAVLALWLGAAGFMSVAVAPALFAVLPTRTLAGAVVGRLLPSVFYAGIIVGLLVIALDVWAVGAWRWSGVAISSLVMIAACAIAQWIVAPRIEGIRASIPGEIDALPLDDARRVAFGRLHGISVGWLGLAILAAAVALVLCARLLETRQP
jgi:hypothetical protein